MTRSQKNPKTQKPKKHLMGFSMLAFVPLQVIDCMNSKVVLPHSMAFIYIPVSYAPITTFASITLTLTSTNGRIFPDRTKSKYGTLHTDILLPQHMSYYIIQVKCMYHFSNSYAIQLLQVLLPMYLVHIYQRSSTHDPSRMHVPLLQVVCHVL